MGLFFLVGCPMGIDRPLKPADAAPEHEQTSRDGPRADLPDATSVRTDGRPDLSADAASDAAASDAAETADAADAAPDGTPDPCATVVCDDAPPTTCVGGQRTSYGSGVCEDGDCSYPPSTFTCPAGCDGPQCACFFQEASGSCLAEGFWSLTVIGFCQGNGMSYRTHNFVGITPCAGADGGSLSYDKANVECCP